MKIYCALLLGLMSAATLSAQTVPPALMVKQDGVSMPLGLATLRTEVRIFGSVAETTTTMTFTNPTARAMEGDLYFPLPEGATDQRLCPGHQRRDGRWRGGREARGPAGLRGGRPPRDRPGAGAVDQGQQLPDPGLSHPGPRQPHGARAVRHGADSAAGRPRPTTCR